VDLPARDRDLHAVVGWDRWGIWQAVAAVVDDGQGRAEFRWDAEVTVCGEHVKLLAVLGDDFELGRAWVIGVAAAIEVVVPAHAPDVIDFDAWFGDDLRGGDADGHGDDRHAGG